MLCTEVVSDIQNNFLYTTCFLHVLQKEELLTKIYLYEENECFDCGCGDGGKKVSEMGK